MRAGASTSVPLAWTWLALPGFLYAAVALALAALIHSTRPEAPQNRRFATALALNALVNTAYASRLLMLDRTDGRAIVFVFMTLAMLWIVAELLFVGTLATPLARPMRTRAAPWALGAAALIGIATLYARPDLYFGEIRPFLHTPGFEFQNGPVWIAQGVVLPLTFFYAMVAAIDAWRRAPPGIARQRAGTFALGFGFANAVAGASIAYLILLDDLTSAFASYVNFLAAPLASLVSAAFIAYGILRFQLFEIDLRIKRGIRGGALAGAFFGVFFVATEAAQIFFEQSVGPIVGLVAAGILVFALHPLQRAADRVANAAMPHVEATPQYLAYRRMEIYREAVESLLADGTLNEKERATLDRLRAKLQIGESDARALESDVARSRAA